MKITLKADFQMNSVKKQAVSGPYWPEAQVPSWVWGTKSKQAVEVFCVYPHKNLSKLTKEKTNQIHQVIHQTGHNQMISRKLKSM